jgi:sulfate transport system ATP-binding protein
VSIEIRGLHKRFGATVVCDGIDLDIASGELVALLGPSGSGKTSLLRIVAGLEQPDAGTVRFHGADARRTDVRDRHVGFVFQHYALFAHMTIFENVAFGLRVKPRATRPDAATIRRKVNELLALVQLDSLADRFPHQLSGGQRQRIALARALAVEPQVLLLDEPFGALDAKVRKDLRRWLRRLHDEVHVTSVFVTHDQDEAMEVADRVVIMNRGRIEQDGTPDQVYDHPKTPFVLQFLGDVNLFRGRFGHAPGGFEGRDGDGSAAPDGPDGARDEVRAARGGPGTDGEVSYVRPHELVILGAPEADTLAVTLSQVLTLGARTRIEFRRDDDGSYVDVEMPREEFAALGRRLTLRPGARAHLKARKVTRFTSARLGEQRVEVDPAAMI